ncbi:hypothetical protein AW069_28950 [Escherichia coli]|nr:hypothetical protein AW069_28950 [Escherichia coli]OTD69693.1 hypothetical protein AW104_28895 [Escherichia coli]
MLPSEIMIWQPEFTDKTLSRKPGAVHWFINRRFFTFPDGGLNFLFPYFFRLSVMHSAYSRVNLCLRDIFKPYTLKMFKPELNPAFI